MSRSLCDFCQALQKRDGELSKEEREKLIHRWRPRGYAEHFRRDCHLWPKDGTAFGQRGIDTRTHVEAGMSHVATIGGLAGGILVSILVPFVILAQTAINIDVALILSAVTPIIVAGGAVYQMYAARKAAADAAEIKASNAELHTLADGQFTREKENRLFEMRLYRATLSRQVEEKALPEDIALLSDLDKRIVALQAEVVARVETVASLPSNAPTPEVK